MAVCSAPSFRPEVEAFGLTHCDAFVTHGGFNSVKEALDEGVPQVVVPISADQPYSAARCAELGVGRTVAAGERPWLPGRDGGLPGPYEVVSLLSS